MSDVDTRPNPNPSSHPDQVSRFFVSHVDGHIYAKRRMLDPTDRLEIQVLPLGVQS